MNEQNAAGREMGWEDEIENDGQFEVLPEGDYRFRVEKFERARHPGSAKIPACNKAILSLSVSSSEASGSVQTSLFLYEKQEWKLCQFFTAIGARKHGERMRMNWSAVPGASGVCHVGVRKWTGNDGKERDGNEVTEFYDPEKAPKVDPAPAAQSYEQSQLDMPPQWNTGAF